MFADARDGLEQGVIAPGRGLGELLELFFQTVIWVVVMADQGQIVLEGQLADRVVFLGQQLFFPRIAVGRVWRRVGRL